MTERTGDWMQTFTGHQYWPCDPRPEDVHIEDIAHALSMLCRYTGHVDRFYSVAEHSWHVSHLVSTEHALAGLMHDATEAYVADMGRPLKKALYDYQVIEGQNWAVIAEAFGLPFELPAEIHEADRNMLTVEKAALMKPGPKPDWGFGEPRSPVKIMAWRPEVAEAMFIGRFYELDAMRGN